MSMLQERLSSKYNQFTHDDISKKEFINSIIEVLDEHNACEVLSFVHKFCSLDLALDLFAHILDKTNHKSIKTIGVFLFRNEDGGITRFNNALIPLWLELGYKVVFFTEDDPDLGELKGKIKHVRLPQYREMASRLELLRSTCLEEKVDVFITHTWWDSYNAYDLALLRTLGIYYMVFMNGYFPATFAREEPLNLFKLYHMADLNICSSEYDYNFCTSSGLKVWPINLPIPDDLKTNTQVSSLNNKIVSIIGRVSPEKNIIDSLKVFKKLHQVDNSIKLNIVGPALGPNAKQYFEKVKRFIKKNGLSESITLYGGLSRKSINEHFLKSDCILFTSKEEGYPMALLEACCFGVPIVMYDLSHLTIVKGNKGVLSSPQYDVNELANNLIALMKDDERRKKAGADARSFFLELAKYQLDKVWLDIFNSFTSDDKKVVNMATVNIDMFANYMLTICEKIVGDKRGSKTPRPVSKDYLVGYIILFIPRKIVRFLRRIRNKLKKDK